MRNFAYILGSFSVAGMALSGALAIFGFLGWMIFSDHVGPPWPAVVPACGIALFVATGFLAVCLDMLADLFD